MAIGEPLTTESPLVTLTGLLLSYVILKAESADFIVRSHPKLGTTIISGDREFSGPDEDKVVEHFLRWIIEREVTMTKEDFDEVELDAPAVEDIGALAAEYAGDGMSEFGKVIESARSERKGIIEKALRERDWDTPGITKIVDLLPELRAKTQLEDLDVAEIMECISDVGLDNLLGELSDATVPVVRSTDKPN